MIIEVVGKEIEKIKGDFESYLNGLNMVGEISYSQYSELYDEGTKQIQRAYELGKSELEEKISVLLSCKNCPENKGGYICQKEYEDKCLAQKIQYIKELKEENAELRKDNSEWEKASDKWKSLYESTNNQLTKAKEIIKELMSFSVQLCDCRHTVDFEKTREEAEQFLKNSEVEK